MSIPSLLPERTLAVRRRRRDELIDALRAALAAAPPHGVRGVRLFGSWARGDFDGRSDIDLLVTTDDGVAFDGRGLPHAERLDVVTVQADRLDRLLESGHSFYGRAMGEAVTLYERGDGVAG